MGLATLSVALLMAIALGRREAVVVVVAVPVTLALTLVASTSSATRSTASRCSRSSSPSGSWWTTRSSSSRTSSATSGCRPHEAAPRHGRSKRPTRWATRRSSRRSPSSGVVPMDSSPADGAVHATYPNGARRRCSFRSLVAFAVSPWATHASSGACRRTRTARRTARRDTLERLYRRAMTPLLTVAATRAWALVAVSRPCSAPRSRSCRWARGREDAAVRQQERVPGGGGHAGGDVARATRGPRGHGARAAGGAGGHRVLKLRRDLAPINFNGLVRHYYLRAAPHQGDVRVNLVPQETRGARHAIAREAGPLVEAIARRATRASRSPRCRPARRAETLVAEIYGPTTPAGARSRRRSRRSSPRTEGVVDVDWYVQGPRRKRLPGGPREGGARRNPRGGRRGDAASGARRTTRPASSSRTSASAIPRRTLTASAATASPALGAFRPAPAGAWCRSQSSGASDASRRNSIYHKNLRPVVYVTAMSAGAGRRRSTQSGCSRRGSRGSAREGYDIASRLPGRRPAQRSTAMKWDGEWQITYEVFRDMGIAFAAVMVLIYILVVGWFGASPRRSSSWRPSR